jgi:putative transcriptional regulator
MTIHHHPNEEFLLDYSTGALAEAWSLAIATHLALCPLCRRRVAELEAIGGELVERMTPVPLAAGTFDDVMSRLGADADEVEEPIVRPATSGGPRPILPQPLRDYVGGDIDDLEWQRLGFGAEQLLVPMDSGTATARLLRIPAGRPVPTHTHQGLEFTLVLSGAFSDATGSFATGDLQEADETLEHQPRADVGEDCICLAVTDAPLRFKSLAARIVQPFIGI